MKKALKLLILNLILLITAFSITPVVNAASDNVPQLVEQAISQKSFFYYNEAYDAVMKLTDESEKNTLLNKLSSISNEVWNDDIKNINNKIAELAKTSSGKIYDEVQVIINNSKIPQIDKDYLLGEVTSWGEKLVWTEDYTRGMDALVAAWNVKDAASVNRAEVYINDIKNSYNKNYLLGELSKLKALVVTSPIKAIAKNSNAVVIIEELDKDNKVVGMGSGFIVSTDGKVITNYHVISWAETLQVTLENGSKYMVDGILGYNKDKDIAILKLKNAVTLPIVQLGDSDKLEIGDDIVAIGNPEGYQNSVSNGIISGLGRTSAIRDGKDIQFTAGITYGSSGGALFNMKGEVVGVTNSGYTSGNLGFAIPINEVKAYLDITALKAIVEVNKPTVPTGLTAKAISNSEIQLQWTPVIDADYYYLYTSDSLNGNFKGFTDPQGEKIPLYYYGDFSGYLYGLADNTTKYYKITAVKNEVESDFSSIVSATTMTNYKYFGFLPEVPYFPNVMYDNAYVSETGDMAAYYYLISALPPNYKETYIKLLESNGWKLTTPPTATSKVAFYEKGKLSLAVGEMDEYFFISGNRLN